jgi:glutathione reductase (NADPH)
MLSEVEASTIKYCNDISEVPMSYDYDLLVIGAGSGGIATARRAAEYGAKVAVIEFDRLGGTCVNRGCIPKKLMVYAAHFPGLMEEAVGYGWSKVESQLDWSQMVEKVNGEVGRLNGIYKKMLDNSKVEIITGVGSFVDSHTVAVGDKNYTGERILIAVGGEPVKPNILGIEHALTSDEIFTLPKKPERLVILGGGYIGSEFAGIFNGLGSEVTQIIRHDHILRGFDQDIREEVQAGMVRHGVNIFTNSQLIAVEKTAEGIQVSVGKGDTVDTVVADALTLAALGRKPRLHGLGLENTQVKLHDGAVVVDEHNRTSEEHIYAVGDCTDRIQLTPVAINEGRAFADTVYGNKPRLMSYTNIPTAIFTAPEAATVGLTEAEAKAQYGEEAIKIYRSKFRPMYYVLPNKEEKTLMKLVVEIATDKVLGAHMVGDYAGEIIQGVAIAVKMGATKANFDATVGIHPSSAEEFVTMR